MRLEYSRAAASRAHPPRYRATRCATSTAAGGVGGGRHRDDRARPVPPIDSRRCRNEAYRPRHRPVALARHVVPAPARPAPARSSGPRHQQIQVLEDQVLFARATGTLRQTSSGNSEAPISDTITALPRPSERSSVPEAFADRRITQIEHDVARRQVADEIFDRREAQHANVRRDPASGSATRRGNRDAARPPGSFWPGLEAEQAAEGAQRFGDALVRRKGLRQFHHAVAGRDLRPPRRKISARSRRPGPGC